MRFEPIARLQQYPVREEFVPQPIGFSRLARRLQQPYMRRRSFLGRLKRQPEIGYALRVTGNDYVHIDLRDYVWRIPYARLIPRS